jgi:dienelactone hydrolase
MDMPARARFGLCVAAVLGTSLSAQIATDLVEKRRADFHTQATDADMKREGGTQPRDWNYDLPGGVTTRQITLYVDGGTPLYGKMFFPRGFTKTGRWPAVVVGHGINALSIGIEKYGARFADRGLVAMAIDYQGHGFSGSGSNDLRLLEADTTTDARTVTGTYSRVLANQGEPGIERARIGVWGTDEAGGHAIVVAATDVRVKAAVAQVPVVDGKDVPRKAFAPSPEQQAAMVKLARSGTAPATLAAAAAMNDQEARLALAEYHPFWYADAIPVTTAVLFVVAEKDLKVNNDTNAVAASKLIKGPNGVTVVPGAGHALATPGAFDAAVDAAAAWCQKYL